MSITINKQPQGVCFAKNQQYVKATSNLFVETLPTQGVFTWFIGAGTSMSAGDIKSIRFWGKVVTWTATATPTLNGFDLPLNGDSTTMLPYIQANAEITNDFVVTKDATNIFFTAKRFGNDTSVYVPGLDPIYFGYTPGINIKIRDNFRLIAEVHAAIDSTTFEKIYSAELSPKRVEGTEGSVELNIEEILRSRLDYDIAEYNDIAWASKVIRNFYVIFFENYGITPNNYLSKKSNVFKALNAGVNARNYPTASRYLVTGLVTDYFFLDLQNRMYINTDGNMRHLLFFMAHGTVNIGASFTVQAIITWSDNSVAYHDIYANIIRATGNDVLIIPCGIPNSPLKAIVSTAAASGLFPLQYTIRVNYNYSGRTSTSHGLFPPKSSGGTAGTLIPGTVKVNADRTFVIDDKYYKSAKYFKYVNSMGGVTCMRTTGEYEYGAQVEFQEFNKELANNYNYLTASERSVFNSMYTETLEVYSGWVTRYDVYLFLDFLLSERKYEQLISNGPPEHFNQNNDMVEIITDPGSVKLYKSNDGMYSFNFKYRYAVSSRAMNSKDIFFSRLLP